MKISFHTGYNGLLGGWTDLELYSTRVDTVISSPFNAFLPNTHNNTAVLLKFLPDHLRSHVKFCYFPLAPHPSCVHRAPPRWSVKFTSISDEPNPTMMCYCLKQAPMLLNVNNYVRATIRKFYDKILVSICYSVLMLADA